MKIYAFGDSFTEMYDDQYAEWIRNYIRWKGYKPKSFIDIISGLLDAEVLNFAKGGNDNYSIIESFIKLFPSIDKDDLILINWASVERFRVVDKNNKWRPLIPNFGKFTIDTFDLSKESIEQIFVNRTSIKYVEEISNYIDFLNFICKDYKIIQWSSQDCLRETNIDMFFINFQTIYEETNGKVYDKHPSESANFILSKHMEEILAKKYNLLKKNII